MIFTRRWLLLFALGVLPLLLTGLSTGFLTLAFVWYALLAAAALADWTLLLPAIERLTAERVVSERLTVGEASEVRIRLRNRAATPIAIELRETPPEGFRHDLPEAPLTFALAGEARQATHYTVTPQERGDFAFGDLYLRAQGRFGLVQRQWRVPMPQQARVFPSLRETANFELLARKGRLQQAGIRAARLQGAGREFESLRDYLPDDEWRRIDWKATARRGKLVSRQYEVERSQNVILALDIGRTMLAEIDGVQKLDYAIQAALLLAYVATLTDDRVGLLVFSDRVHTYLPPKQGRAQVYAILEAIYAARADLIEPSYRVALNELRRRWRKRSLLVCFTDLWDAESSRQTVSELAAMQAHHLVCAVTLLDTKMQRAADQEAQSASEVYGKAVASQVLTERAKAMAALQQRGVLVVDSPAERLSAELVNRYLEIKERMLL